MSGQVKLLCLFYVIVNVSLQIVSRKIDFEKKNIQRTDKKIQLQARLISVQLHQHAKLILLLLKASKVIADECSSTFVLQYLLTSVSLNHQQDLCHNKSDCSNRIRCAVTELGPLLSWSDHQYSQGTSHPGTEASLGKCSIFKALGTLI